MNAIKRKSMQLVCVLAMALILLFAGKVQLSAATTAPTGLTQTDATDTWVTIKWNAVMQDNINYYWRISEESTFAASKSGKVWDAATTDNITGLASGTTYYVQVGTSKTYQNTAPADTVWSSPLEVTTAPKSVTGDSIKLVDASTTSITLTWDAVDGANYYEVRYWVSGTDWDSASVISSATTSVQITGLEKNTKYNARVYSYRVASTGYKAGYCYSSEKSDLKVLPTKITGLENTKFYPFNNAPSFAWDEGKTADGYQYYIYDNANKKILSGKTNYAWAYANSNKFKKNQFYRIKVRGYVNLANNKVKYGEWSDVTYFAKTPYQKVSAKQSGKNIKVSWNKVTGATNYTVYVSNKPDSGYKKVATVKKTSTTIKKYGKSSLKKGKTYYIRVVANKTVKVNGKNKTYKSTFEYDYAKSVTMKK